MIIPAQLGASRNVLAGKESGEYQPFLRVVLDLCEDAELCGFDVIPALAWRIGNPASYSKIVFILDSALSPERTNCMLSAWGVVGLTLLMGIR